MNCEVDNGKVCVKQERRQKKKEEQQTEDPGDGEDSL